MSPKLLSEPSLLSEPPLSSTASDGETHSVLHGRRFDIDALRVLAFILLILYHCGMFYVADWGWHVKSTHLSSTLQNVMLLVNQWRMALLFMISGLASSFLLTKTNALRFASSRLRRLLLPLIFGTLVIVAPQAYFQGLSNGTFDYIYSEFYWRYLSLQSWPVDAFDGWEYGWTWNHLWYLPYVLAYCLILAGLSPLLNTSRGQAALQYCRRAQIWAIYLAPILLIWALRMWLRRDYPETHNFHRDWYLHAYYFSLFMLGYVLGNSAHLWQQLGRWRWLSLTMALIGYGGIIWGRERLPETLSGGGYALVYTWLAANTWSWLCTVLGWAHRHLNRPLKYLPYASEAVISWYILHQSITVIAGFYLARWAWLQQHPGAGLWEAILLVLITLLGCFALHEYVIRRINFLRPLFGLKLHGLTHTHKQQSVV